MAHCSVACFTICVPCPVAVEPDGGGGGAEEEDVEEEEEEGVMV